MNEIKIKSLRGGVLFSHECEWNTERNTVIEAILRGISLQNTNLSYFNLRRVDFGNVDLSGACFFYANLSGCNFNGAKLDRVNFSDVTLSECKGLRYSQCSFAGHGERGRMLTAIYINNEIKLFCGCFNGTKDELMEYIEDGEEVYKASRLLALETVLKLIKV